jgi:molybdopterin/thiamine biosynthesis adenylyltransferase
MTVLERFDRQARIRGWDQERLQRGRVAVHGRDWLGTYVVWALASLGIGTVVWVGRPRPRTEGLASRLLNIPCPWGDGTILNYPFDIEYGPELDWSLAGPVADLLVIATEDPIEQALSLDWAAHHGIPVLVGSATGAGWFGLKPPPDTQPEPQDPILSLVVAALLVDAVRERLCPLAGGLLPAEGRLELSLPTTSPARLDIVLIGVGAIGVYAAIALAAAYGPRLHFQLWDFDHVEMTNLNRQGLFTTADARDQVPKAYAAKRALAGLFPEVRMKAEVRRLAAEDARRLDALSPRPTALLSAVDNAATRLVLQGLGQELGLAVIQGGTGTFSADCFTQEAGGPLLDDQMHGALTTAATREGAGGHRHRGCAVDPSYIVPGMMAGAFLALRSRQLGLEAGLPPIRWRSGSLPLDERTTPRGFESAELVV